MIEDSWQGQVWWSSCHRPISAAGCPCSPITIQESHVGPPSRRRALIGRWRAAARGHPIRARLRPLLISGTPGAWAEVVCWRYGGACLSGQRPVDALAALAVQRWLGSCRRRQVVLAPPAEGTRHFMRPSCPRFLRWFPFLFFFTSGPLTGILSRIKRRCCVLHVVHSFCTI